MGVERRRAVDGQRRREAAGGGASDEDEAVETKVKVKEKTLCGGLKLQRSSGGNGENLEREEKFQLSRHILDGGSFRRLRGAFHSARSPPPRLSAVKNPAAELEMVFD